LVYVYQGSAGVAGLPKDSPLESDARSGSLARYSGESNEWRLL
jgi:hypothetical protein